MKCTSYLISKKLKEAGFVGNACDYHCDEERVEAIMAYDLETILEALPKDIDQDGCSEIGLRVWWADGANWIGYQHGCSGFYISEHVKENESLADTAGRLWLSLKEKELV